MRATRLGGIPTASRKRAISRRWLHPSSPARAPIAARPPLPARTRSDQATPGVGRRRLRQARRERPLDQGDALGRAPRLGDPPGELRRGRPEHVLQRHRAVGQLAHRQAEEAPGRERGKVDLQAARGPAVAHDHGPIGEAGDEGPQPLRGAVGAAAVGDAPAGVHVDDDRHVGARQLAEGHGRGRALRVPRVADHLLRQEGMRGDREELRAHPGHASPSRAGGPIGRATVGQLARSQFRAAESGPRLRFVTSPDRASRARSEGLANWPRGPWPIGTFTIRRPRAAPRIAQAGAPSAGRAAISRVRSMSCVICATRASGESNRRSSRSRSRNSIRIVRP